MPDDRRGRYCGGAVALKKAGGSAIPLPPGLLKVGDGLCAVPEGGRFLNRPYAERRGRRSLHGGIVYRLRCLVPNQERRVQFPLPPPKVRKTEAPGFYRVGRACPARVLYPSK